MIIAANQVYGVSTRCADGFLAKVDDLLFDDRSWNVTYLVIRFGGWLNRRRVLVTPEDIAGADWSAGRLELRLTSSQLQRSPSLESHLPVAMWKSLESQQFIAWDGYWAGVFEGIDDKGDPHLRNTQAVTGHRVLGLDAEAGYVDNFVIEDAEWRIRYLVVRMGRRRSGKRVVVEPHWVDSIVWKDRGVLIHLPKAQIEHGREFVAEVLATAR